MGRNYVDIRGLPGGFKEANGKQRVSAMPYLYDIAEGNVSNHWAWTRLGYNPALTTEEDIWSASSVYAFPAAAMSMEIDSADADDVGAVIKGNAEGAAQALVADTGSTTTTLYDASVDFSAATAVAVGDCILVDPKGAVPEYGFVTDITNSATGTLVVGGGFSQGGNPAGRAYTIVDRTGDTGAQVVKIEYLDSNYSEHTCLACLNGTTNVVLDNAAGAANSTFFRINNFSVICAGSSNAAEGALTIVDAATHAIVYSNITAANTVARSAIYTVPRNKKLYITSITGGYGRTGSPNVEFARVYLVANVDPISGFHTPLFYPYTEMMLSNATTIMNLDCPVMFDEFTDIKVSATASAAGAVTVLLNGWLENV